MEKDLFSSYIFYPFLSSSVKDPSSVSLLEKEHTKVIFLKYNLVDLSHTSASD